MIENSSDYAETESTSVKELLDNHSCQINEDKLKASRSVDPDKRSKLRLFARNNCCNCLRTINQDHTKYLRLACSYKWS